MRKKEIVDKILGFHLPAYKDVPDVGLYLDQSVKYINTFFKEFPNMELTGSMVSNYVKKGIIDRPEKKTYSRDQICYLFFIVIAKSVLSIENIQLLFEAQKKVYKAEVAYEYLRLELNNVLEYVLDVKDSMAIIGHSDTVEKTMLRNTILAIAYKMYLEMFFESIQGEKKSSNPED